MLYLKLTAEVALSSWHLTDSVQCFVVATLASMTPADAFLFRNYEHPRDPAPSPVPLNTPRGSSKHEVWQAVRASSAAPYYLDDFLCGSDRSACWPCLYSMVSLHTFGCPELAADCQRDSPCLHQLLLVNLH